MSTYTGSELATKYAAYLIYKGTATPTEINQMTSPKLGYVFDVTANGTITNGNITVVAGDAIVYLAQGWTHMNNGSADQQIATLSAQVTQLISLIGNTDFSRFALKTEIPTVPTKVSAFQNDSGYLTQHQSLAAYQTKANSDAAYVGKLNSLETTAANGTIVQYTGATTATLTKGHFYIYETGTGWSEINLGNGEGDGIKQKNSLSTGTEGEVVFYTGTTTEDYTTNNFYKYSNGEWAWVDLPSLTFAYNATTKTLSIEYGEATQEVNINNIIKDNTDDELNNTSENPIQNKVVAEALSDIEEVTDKLTTDLSGLHMEFDADNLQLVLLDSADQVIGTANLSTLAKDAMLEDVEIFTESESGVSVSTPYLKFTFNTDAGTQPIRVPLTDFVINVTTDTVLSPVSTNPVQNKVIYEAIQALQTAINNITGTPDAALSTTSIKPVQNRVITNELNGVKDRVAALEGSGINYKYFKQVENLDTYQAEDGEIVEYIGSTNSKYTHGYVYERDTSKDVPAGSLIIHINTEESYNYNEDGTEKTITIPKQDFIAEDSSTFPFYILDVTRRINSSYTHNGIINSILNLSQAVSGMTVLVSFESQLTGQILITLTYENGEWKDENNYTYTINNSTKLTKPSYTLKGEINKKIIYETSDYYWAEGLSFDGGFITLIIHLTNNPTIETISEAIIFWQQTNVQPQKDTSTIESNIAALQTDKANEVTSFTEAATRANIASGDTVTTIWGKIKKWFSDLKAVAFSGSYNDLSNKPSKNYVLDTTRPLSTSENKSSDYYLFAPDIIKGEYHIVNFDMIISSTITFTTTNPIYIYYNSGTFLWIVSSGTYQAGEYHITKRITIPDTFNNPRFYITANDVSLRGIVSIKNCRIERENDNGWQPNTSDEQIYFTSDTVSGNIASGETLAVMMKKIAKNSEGWGIGSVADIESHKGFTTPHAFACNQSFSIGTTSGSVTLGGSTKGILINVGGDIIMLAVETSGALISAYIDPNNHWQTARRFQ